MSLDEPFESNILLTGQIVLKLTKFVLYAALYVSSCIYLHERDEDCGHDVIQHHKILTAA